MSINLYNNDYIRFSTSDGKEFVCLIQWDTCAENPRKEAEPFTHMFCWHSRYNIGDTHFYEKPEDFLKELAGAYCDMDLLREVVLKGQNDVHVTERDGKFYLEESWYGKEYEIAQSDSKDGLFTNETKDSILEALNCSVAPFIQEDQVAILPIYLYDHSGLTLSTSDVGDKWDSGQIGWIYTTKADILRETGYDEANWKSEALQLLRDEVETYNQYLSGDVYGYTLCQIDDPNRAWKDPVDSCWGFYGTDILKNGIADYAEGLLDAINRGTYTTGEAKVRTNTSYSFA